MSMYEEHVRFMILGEHELCHVVATANNPEGHNSHLNIEQMNKVDTWHLAHMLGHALSSCPCRAELQPRQADLMLCRAQACCCAPILM